MEPECDNCESASAVILADGLKLCAKCHAKLKEEYDQ